MFRRILAGAFLFLALALPAVATVNTTANKVVVSGTGVQTQFAFSFIGVASAYITVIYTDASGNQTTLSQGSGATQYQISLNAPVQGAIWGVGGTVTYNPNGSPIATGTTLTIFRTLPLTQPISLQNQLSVQTLGKGSEQAVDQSVLEIQQVSELFGRAIIANIANSSPPAPLPPAVQVAGLGLCFDGTGNNVIGCSLAPAGIISSAMAPVVSAVSITAARNILSANTPANTVRCNPLNTPSVLTDCQAFELPYTGGIWTNGVPAAFVSRVDRLLVGTATINAGTTPDTTVDWLETLIPDTTSVSQLASISPLAGIGVLGAARSSDNPGHFGIGVGGFNNNNNIISSGWAFYGEAWNNTSTTNATFTTGMELDIVNKNTNLITFDPYLFINNGQTVAAWIASGGSRAGAQTASAAIGIIDNGAQYAAGIIFKSTSIAGSAPQPAIELAATHKIAWYTAAGAQGGSISGISGGGLSFNFGNNFAIQDNPALQIDIKGHLNTTSGLTPVLSTCGTSPSITGNDWGGIITAGSTAASCDFSFVNAYVTAPLCLVNDALGGTPPVITTRNNLGVAFLATAGASYIYHCFGQPGG